MSEERKIIRRNKEASIARIINAAAAVFADKGYEDATYTEIARLANLNISLISRYFGTKEKLLQATVNVMTSRINVSFDDIPVKDTLIEEMHSLADVLMDTIIKYENETKTVANIAAVNKTFRHELYKITGSNEAIEKRLKRFSDSGAIHKSHNLRYIVDTFVGMVNSFTLFHKVTFRLPESNVSNRVHYFTEMFAKSLALENDSKYPETFVCEKEIF